MVDPRKPNKTRVPAVIVVDELGQLEVPTRSNSYIDPNRRHYWAAVMKRGRGSNVVCWNGTQNPVYVPEDFLRLASNFFCFRLNNPADRKRMAGYMGPQVEEPIMDRHGFWYFNVGGMLHPQYFKQLTLSELPSPSTRGTRQIRGVRRP